MSFLTMTLFHGISFWQEYLETLGSKHVLCESQHCACWWPSTLGGDFFPRGQVVAIQLVYFLQNIHNIHLIHHIWMQSSQSDMNVLFMSVFFLHAISCYSGPWTIYETTGINHHKACHSGGHFWDYYPSAISYLQVKSLKLIWRLHTPRFHLPVLDLQPSCRDLTTRYQDSSPSSGC